MALMPIDEAAEAALQSISPLETELRPVAPENRFLAEPIVAPRDLPGCDNSAMDGYAVRAADTSGASRASPVRLRVVDIVYAGHPASRSVGPGEAVRLFTGAPVPEGADAIVRQEAAIAGGGFVDVVTEARIGEHIRRRGEEIPSGAPVFEPGARVDAYVAGVLASLGIAEVRTFRRPRVLALTVGDELVEPGSPALPHQVYASNAYLLWGLCTAAGAEIVGRRRERDDVAALARALSSALELADMVITTGGASVGDRDLVKQALRELGATFSVDGVALKPGKPVAVASVRGRHVAVLPGNPGAAAVAFDRLVRPMLLGLQGSYERRRTVTARLDSTRTKQAGLTWFLSAKLEQRDGQLWARVRPQGAGQLFGNVELDGWVLLPRGRAEFHSGEPVTVELVGASTFTSFASRASVAPAADGDRVPAVSIVGWSDAGKTTLIERLLVELEHRGLRVAVAKHTTHAHPLHKDGSDTELFARNGASAVAFLTPDGAQLTWRPGDEGRALRVLSQVGGAQLVLVEGWKDGPLPKVVVRSSDKATPDVDAVIATVEDAQHADVGALVDAILSATRVGGSPSRR